MEKPWITYRFKNQYRLKIFILQNLLNCKDLTKELKYKINTNSRGISYQHYLSKVNSHVFLLFFPDNIKNLKYILKEMKSIISIKIPN